jgi:hypothetical protein
LALGTGLAAVITAAISAGMSATHIADPWTIVAISTITLGLQMYLTASYSRRTARRLEIVRSFAGHTVRRDGVSIAVDASSPLLGEYSTRRDAAWSAARCGRWGVLVRAYGRFYVLVGDSTQPGVVPVSFRSRAVADVVPAYFDGAISA